MSNLSKLPENFVWNIGCAVSKLGECLASTHSPARALQSLGDAMKALEESMSFCHDFTMTEEESELSYAFHTYLRKYDDCSAGTLLWVLWNSNSGALAWKAGIQDLIAAEFWRGKFQHSRLDELVTDSPKDQVMKLAFRAWLDIDDKAKDFCDFIADTEGSLK